MSEQFTGLESLEPRLLLSSTFTAKDADGDRFTVTVEGPGQAVVVQQTPDSKGRGAIQSIQLSGTDSTSVLTITVKKKVGRGNGIVNVGSITGGSIGTIDAIKADLIGNGTNMTGDVGAMTVRRMTNNAAILVGGVLGQFTARDVGRATIQASRAGLIDIIGAIKKKAKALMPGNFGARLTLTDTAAPWTLQTLRVKNSINGAEVRVAKSIQTVTAATAINSIIFAGIDASKSRLPDSESEFVNKAGRIDTFRLTGAKKAQFWIASTYVAAWTLNNFEVGFANPNNAIHNHSEYGAGVGRMDVFIYTDSSGRKVVNDPANAPLNFPNDFGIRFFDV